MPNEPITIKNLENNIYHLKILNEGQYYPNHTSNGKLSSVYGEILDGPLAGKVIYIGITQNHEEF